MSVRILSFNAIHLRKILRESRAYVVHILLANIMHLPRAIFTKQTRDIREANACCSARSSCTCCAPNDGTFGHIILWQKSNMSQQLQQLSDSASVINYLSS
jgi:hypothetical protein